MKALSSDIVAGYLGIDRKGFAGLRDLVTHPYFGLDTRRLLPIVQTGIPSLLIALEAEPGPDRLLVTIVMHG